jgi:RNA polymerase-binding transcription factor DksA
MDHTQLTKHKESLEKERLLLLEEIKKSEKPSNFGDDVDGFDEKTDETEDFSNKLAEAGDLKMRLEEIDVALSKIRNGNYGICADCGKEIEAEVLSVSPEAPLCKSCAVAK